MWIQQGKSQALFKSVPKLLQALLLFLHSTSRVAWYNKTWGWDWSVCILSNL